MALVYVALAVASVALVPPEALTRSEATAFASAGQAAFVTAGLWIATLDAVRAAGSAINATLFSTARLMQTVGAISISQDTELAVPHNCRDDQGPFPSCACCACRAQSADVN